MPFSASQLHYAVKCCTQHSPHAVIAMVKSVLIADDNAFVRQRLGELFGREPDFEVCAVAENGRKAIEEAQESLPDLILLDLSMPVMNGLDAARALKRLMPKVPIVMFSAYSDPFTEKEAHSAGVSALVSKFEDTSALVRTARNLVYATAHPSNAGEPICENGS
jgi:DNA-binding NarL/FixJ family response regulator